MTNAPSYSLDDLMVAYYAAALGSPAGTQNPVTGAVLGVPSSAIVDATANGIISALNATPTVFASTALSTVGLGPLNGTSNISVQVPAASTLVGTLSLLVSLDNINFVVVVGPATFLNVATGAYSANITAPGIYQADIAGYKYARISCTAFTSGTTTTAVFIEATTAPGTVALDAALPAGAAIIGALLANQSVNVAQVNGVASAAGNGTSAAGMRVALGSDSTGQVAIASKNTGGLTKTRVVAAATTNSQLIRGSAGTYFGFCLTNVAAYPVFLKIYDKATAPTVGTDTPAITIGIPAGATVYQMAADMGIVFSAGVGIGITKLSPDADVTVLVAGDVTGSIYVA